MSESLAESLSMPLQFRQYQISKNDDEHIHEKLHEYDRPLGYQMDKIDQQVSEDGVLSQGVLTALSQAVDEGIKTFLADPFIGQVLAQYEVQRIVLDIVERAKCLYQERPRTGQTDSQ